MVSGRSPSGRAGGPADLSQSSLSQPSALIPNAVEFPEFVTFDVQGPKREQSTEITVRLKRAIRLYDEARHSEYTRVRAIAKRRGKKDLGLHPCCTVTAEPRDWSDGVDSFSAKPAVSA
jgi:hypothetical protein